MALRLAIPLILLLLLFAGCAGEDDGDSGPTIPEGANLPPLAATLLAGGVSDRTPPPGGTAVPAGLPAPVAAARDYLAEIFERDPVEIQVVSVTSQQWPDSCLGVPEEDEVCAQVITPGYEVVLGLSENEYIFRTNGDGTIVRLSGLNFLDN